MNRKEKVLGYIFSAGYVPLRLEELAAVLDVPREDIDRLREILDELCLEGKVCVAKRMRYCPVRGDVKLAKGTLCCVAGRGSGFVCCDGEEGHDVFIRSRNMGTALDKDRVLVCIEKEEKNGSHREGRVLKVLERGVRTLIGTLKGMKGGFYRVASDNNAFFATVRVNETDLNGAVIGDRVVAEITSYSNEGKPHGVIVSRICSDDDAVAAALNTYLTEKNGARDFPPEIKDEAAHAPESVSEDEIRGREDLRDKTIFTIDGDDSRDFDDAVSLERDGDGFAILGVHIADVTHYVKDDSAIDREALRRATSIYCPHTVIPMLPEELSNGICSLNPDTDRLTLSVFMKIDGKGEILASRISKSVIHSCARMTYGNVNKILDGDTKLREKYAAITQTLESMAKLSDVLENVRAARGAIDFDFPETRIICGEKCIPTDIVTVRRGAAERMIESFMIAANETVAKTARGAGIPFIYRVHEPPDEGKLTQFNEFLKNFGYGFKTDISPEKVKPDDFRQLLRKIKGTPEEMMIATEMLRSLMKARYLERNEGHFGLAAKFYCHFTSPIRRYPDLFIHRVLKEFIGGTLDKKKMRYFAAKVGEAAAISSEREVTAQEIERGACDMLKAAYMKRYLGETFETVISGVTSFGIFAETENLCEGLIRYKDLKDDRYEYDGRLCAAVGERTGKVYKVGDRIKVTVAACSVAAGNIDFVPEIQPEEKKPQKPKRKKAAYRRRHRKKRNKR